MLRTLHPNTSTFLKHETRWLNNLNDQRVCRGRRWELFRFDVDKSYLRWYYSTQDIEETKPEEKLGQYNSLIVEFSYLTQGYTNGLGYSFTNRQ